MLWKPWPGRVMVRFPIKHDDFPMSFWQFTFYHMLLELSVPFWLQNHCSAVGTSEKTGDCFFNSPMLVAVSMSRIPDVYMIFFFDATRFHPFIFPSHLVTPESSILLTDFPF